MSKRLNEYNVDDLVILQQAITIAYHQVKRNNPEFEFNRLILWSADVREALHDVEVEADSLPWKQEPSKNNVVMVIEPLNDLP